MTQIQTVLMCESKHDMGKYSHLIDSSPTATGFHTQNYVEFVSEWLDAESYYIGAFEEGKQVGMIPAVIKKNGLGNVINSLPFFGSPGGAIVSPSITPKKSQSVRQVLFERYHELADSEDCILSTVIVPPLEKHPIMYEDCFTADYRDTRIAQITRLPPGTADEVEETILERRFSRSCRRGIRKAREQEVEVRTTNRYCDMGADFYEIYHENLLNKGQNNRTVHEGGSIKSSEFFKNFLNEFDNTRLRIAVVDGQVVMGILEFYTDTHIEYYQATIDPEYRDTYATNLGVLQGMIWGTKTGREFYSFGGTWLSQEGLFNFKRQFGTDNHWYHYYTTAYDDISHILDYTPSGLSKEYPGFYVLPYAELED